jgi:hypothetical protein
MGNALLVRRSTTASCFSPRQLEAAPDGEKQTQACPEDGSEITGSRTIQIRSPEQPHFGEFETLV